MLQEFLYILCLPMLRISCTIRIITVHFSLLIDSIFNYAISSSRQHSVEWHNDKQIMKWKEYMCSWSLINPLGPESNAQGTLQKTQDVNDHPLFCMFLANNFSDVDFLCISMSTTFRFWCHIVNLLPWHMTGGPDEAKRNLSWYSSQDSHLIHLQWNTEVLPLGTTCSVIFMALPHSILPCIYSRPFPLAGNTFRCNTSKHHMVQHCNTAALCTNNPRK